MIGACTMPILFALLGLSPDDVSGSRLLKFAQKRSLIRSYEVRIHVRFLVSRENPAFDGADWTYVYWSNSDRSKYRLDRRMKGDKRLERADVSDKYSYDGRVYRLIDRMDGSSLPLREYRRMTPRIVPELYDVRLFGLYFDSFTVLHSFSMKDLERLVTNAASLKTEALADGGFRETYLHGDGLQYRYEFSRSGVPVSFEAEGRTGPKPIRYEARVGYSSRGSDISDLPSRIEFKRFTNRRLTQHEVVELDVVRLNEPIGDEICSWESLRPPPGRRLAIDNGYYHMNTMWNGSRFVAYVPPPPDTLAARRSPLRKSVVPLVITSTTTLLLAALLIYTIRKARVQTRD